MTFAPGDLIAFYGTDWPALAIRAGTLGGPSHIGIVCEYRGDCVLVESTTLCRTPCLVQGVIRPGVQVQNIEDRIAAYPRTTVSRLAPHWSLSASESELLSKILIEHFVGAGTRYDLAGAVISGTRLIKHLLPSANVDVVFCSELAAFVLMRLGRLPLGNPGTYTPAGVLRAVKKAAVYLRPVDVT